jgi:hypothetical protein
MVPTVGRRQGWAYSIREHRPGCAMKPEQGSPGRGVVSATVGRQDRVLLPDFIGAPYALLTYAVQAGCRIPGERERHLADRVVPTGTHTFHPYRPHRRLLCNELDPLRLCPVQWTCLGFALAQQDLMGIWGETTERERREMRRGAVA